MKDKPDFAPSESKNSQVSSAQLQVGQVQSAKPNMVSGRDNRGRFKAGHRESVGNAGNPNPPVNRVVTGNRLAFIHGGYAKHLDSPELFAQAGELRLVDELVLCRTRVLTANDMLEALKQDLGCTSELAERLKLYDLMAKAEQALDRTIQRIESIERTLSALRIDTVTVPRIAADTLRIQAATRKLSAEADKLEKEGCVGVTPISQMLSELQAMGTGGLML